MIEGQIILKEIVEILKLEPMLAEQNLLNQSDII